MYNKPGAELHLSFRPPGRPPLLVIPLTS